MNSKRYRPCVLATCCVPWDDDFTFAEEVFRRAVRHVLNQGIQDLYIFGTAGEGYAVTEAQFDQITRVFLDETRRERVQTMIGIISPSLPTVIERIERSCEFGALRFQISLPNWGALNDKEMMTFFRETCGRFPECEFLHYNLMRTGRVIHGAEYADLAERHPNLVATKNSTADDRRLESLMREAPQLQHFITEAGFAKAALLGECGLLISVASTNMALGQQYFRAGLDRDSQVLQRLCVELEELRSELLGCVAGGAHMDGAYDKMFCRVHHDEFPLRLLPPYEAASEGAYQRYVDILKSRHPRWLPKERTSL